MKYVIILIGAINKQTNREDNMGTLEDKHCQIILKNENDEVNDILMNYDLILRTNDNRTKYEYFDIYNYRDSKMVVGGIPINQRLKQQANK